MAPSSILPSRTYSAKRPAWGPENEKSTFLAMPLSKTSRWAGMESTDCTMCRSCTFSVSTSQRHWAKKSACFWLSPSMLTLSPGRITASSSFTASPASTTFPSIT